MYKRILIATDGSELADKAVATGLMLAKQLEASIVAVHVTEPWATDISPELKNESFLREHSGACANHAAKILGAVAARARAMGVDYIVRHIPDRFKGDFRRAPHARARFFPELKGWFLNPSGPRSSRVMAKCRGMPWPCG